MQPSDVPEGGEGSGDPAHEARDAQVVDLPLTAAIHGEGLPDGFFVRFGVGFLAVYHGRFLAGPAATMLVTGPPGAPRAFLAGTLDNAAHYRWFVRHAGPVVRAAVTALAVRPGVALELVRTRARRYVRGVLRLLVGRRGREADDDGGRPGQDRRDGGTAGAPPTDRGRRVVAVLTHVAVAPACRGAGDGRRLVETFVGRARAHGAHEIRLITPVTTDARGFYRRLGWSSLGERRASDGRLVEEFQLLL